LLAEKYKLSDKVKLLGASEMAAALGRQSEHKAFFKLYSKLIHPSAYLVNGSADTWGAFIREALAINLQIYALDLLEKVRQSLGVPDSVVSPPREAFDPQAN
jgi:hypothetical protein